MADKKVNKYIFEYKMGFITILSFILLIIPVLMTWLYYKFTGNNLEIELNDSKVIFAYIILFVLIFGWMVLHEIIHGVSYQVNGAKYENITFGVALEKGIFYCKCGEFINRRNVLISILAPFVLIGVVTLIIGYLINSFILIVLSIVNISGAAGDLALFGFFVRRDKDFKFKELGDSTTFCLETKEDLTKRKFLSVKLKKIVTDEKEIVEEKSKKISVTKPSWVVLIVLGIIILIDVILCFL